MFLALVMALALAVPAMAEDVKVEGSITVPTINVVMPTTASIMLNPYGLSVTLVKGGTPSTEQVISPVMQVKNLSDIGMKVAIKVAGTKGKGTADFSSADLDPDTTTVTAKVANIVGYFKIVTNAALADDQIAAFMTAAVNADPSTNDDGAVQVMTVGEGATAPEVTAFTAAADATEGTGTDRNVLAPSADKKNPADYGVLAFTFTGTAVASPQKTESGVTSADPWTEKDTLGATVSFTFTPVPGAIATTPSNP